MWPLLLALCFIPLPDAEGELLLREDFDAPVLDKQVWNTATWDLGRSRLSPQNVTIDNGVARLAFNSFDPQAPGERTVGGELYSKQAFAPPAGGHLSIKARVRFDDAPAGLVASIFTYAVEDNAAGDQVSDEIDFEFLSALNQPEANAAKVTLTTWDDWNEKSPTYHDEVTHSSRTVELPDLELGEFNEYEIRWFAGKVEWRINGELVRTAEVAVPTQASPVRFNLWAAGKGWTEAYGKDLQPTTKPETAATYEIDWVEVRAVPAARQD